MGILVYIPAWHLFAGITKLHMHGSDVIPHSQSRWPGTGTPKKKPGAEEPGEGTCRCQTIEADVSIVVFNYVYLYVVYTVKAMLEV